ncbi:MAG: 50S ribosomal protein L10 [Candidatus Paceibacterota bacterium]
MSITKQKKGEILEKIQKKLSKAGFVAFVNFHGLNVAHVSDLRKKLKAAGAEYDVVKKTLVKKGLTDIKYGGELPKLDGEVAVITSVEPLAPSKVIHDFIKKNKVLSALGGVYEKTYVGADIIKMLGSIPPREVLLAQIVNIINSPIQGIVVALDRIANKKV